METANYLSKLQGEEQNDADVDISTNVFGSRVYRLENENAGKIPYNNGKKNPIQTTQYQCLNFRQLQISMFNQLCTLLLGGFMPLFAQKIALLYGLWPSIFFQNGVQVWKLGWPVA